MTEIALIDGEQFHPRFGKILSQTLVSGVKTVVYDSGYVVKGAMDQKGFEVLCWLENKWQKEQWFRRRLPDGSIYLVSKWFKSNETIPK